MAVGTDVANRPRAETEGLIGFFVNQVVLRTRVAGSLRTLVGQVRETTLGAYDHQEVPFERVVEALGTERAVNRAPLVQVKFLLHEARPAYAHIVLS